MSGHKEGNVRGFRQLEDLGSNFIEFDTALSAEFNERVFNVMLAEEANQQVRLPNYLDKNEFKEYLTSHPEWWNECSSLRKKKMYQEFDFLSFPHAELKVIRNTINECLDLYLDLYKKEYRSIRPNYFHSWAVICKLEKQAERPHVHHFNPLNIAGVYYVDGEFSPGNGELEIFPDNKKSNLKLTYLPSAGKIIFFPAPLPHSIGYFDGKKIRLSIAFDIWFQRG